MTNRRGAHETTLAVRRSLEQRWPHERFVVEQVDRYQVLVSLLVGPTAPTAQDVTGVAGSVLPQWYDRDGRRAFVTVLPIPSLIHVTHALVRQWHAVRLGSPQVSPATAVREATAASRSWVGDRAPVLERDEVEFVHTVLTFLDITDEDYFQHTLHRRRHVLLEDVTRGLLCFGEALETAAGIHRSPAPAAS